MDYENYTLLAQKALKQAIKLAKELFHKAVENGHILKAILQTDEVVIPFILQRVNTSVAELEDKVEGILSTYAKHQGGQLTVSSYVQKTLSEAAAFSKTRGEEYISVEHILGGILSSGDSVATMLKNNGVNDHSLQSAINELYNGSQVSKNQGITFNLLNKYAKNLTELCQKGDLPPFTGRAAVIAQIMRILVKRDKNNVLLLGPKGVGKTSIAYGLAHRIEQDDISDNLRSKQVVYLNLEELLALNPRGERFSETLASLLDEVKTVKSDIILFIDEIHLLAGLPFSGDNALLSIKRALIRDEIKVIGATGDEQYQSLLANENLLLSKFEEIHLDEPGTTETFHVIQAHLDRLQNHHKVTIHESAVQAAIELSQRYMPEVLLPEKALDLLDEAASKTRLEINALPGEIFEIEQKIRLLKVEKEALKGEENSRQEKELTARIANLSDERTRLRAIWESEKEIVNTISKLTDDLRKSKSEAALAQAEGNFEKAARLKFEKMDEIQHRIERLNADLHKKKAEAPLVREEVRRDTVLEVLADRRGIPLGRLIQPEEDRLMKLEDALSERIVGQRHAVSALANAVRRAHAGFNEAGQVCGMFVFWGPEGVGKSALARELATCLHADNKAYYRFDLADFSDPASYAANLELIREQIVRFVSVRQGGVILFDEADKAPRALFNDLLLILGEGHLADGQRKNIDLSSTLFLFLSNAGSEKVLADLLKEDSMTQSEWATRASAEALKILRINMSDEFLHRLDDVVVFNPLTFQNFKSIVRLQIDQLCENLAKQNVLLRVSAPAISWLARQSFRPLHGARQVASVIRTELSDKLAASILASPTQEQRAFLADYAGGEFLVKAVSPDELKRLEKRGITPEEEALLKTLDEVNENATLDKSRKKKGGSGKLMEIFKT